MAASLPTFTTFFSLSNFIKSFLSALLKGNLFGSYLLPNERENRCLPSFFRPVEFVLDYLGVMFASPILAGKNFRGFRFGWGKV